MRQAKTVTHADHGKRRRQGRVQAAHRGGSGRAWRPGAEASPGEIWEGLSTVKVNQERTKSSVVQFSSQQGISCRIMDASSFEKGMSTCAVHLTLHSFGQTDERKRLARDEKRAAASDGAELRVTGEGSRRHTIPSPLDRKVTVGRDASVPSSVTPSGAQRRSQGRVRQA